MMFYSVGLLFSINCQALQSNEQRIVRVWKTKNCPGCEKQKMEKYPDREWSVFRLPPKDGQMAHRWFDNKHLHQTIIVEAMVDPSPAVSRHQEP